MELFSCVWKQREGDRWRESVDTRSYLTPLTCVKLFTSATRQKNQTQPKFCSFVFAQDLRHLHGSGLVSVDGFFILIVHHFVITISSSCSPAKYRNWSRPVFGWTTHEGWTTRLGHHELLTASTILLPFNIAGIVHLRSTCIKDLIFWSYVYICSLFY